MVRFNITSTQTCSPGPAPCPPPPPSKGMQTAIVGKCVQPYAPSKDPKIDTVPMSYIFECDGIRGLKATMFNDTNCVTKGSWADFYRGVEGTGPGVNFSIGHVYRLSLDKPTMLGNAGPVHFLAQLNVLHGCKAPPSPPAPPPAPSPDEPAPKRIGGLPTNTWYMIAIVAAAVVGLGAGMLVGTKCSSGAPKDSSIQSGLLNTR